jgi:hypothetical protein
MTKKEGKTAAEVLEKYGVERPDFDGEPSWESRPGRRKKIGERGRPLDKRTKKCDRVS